jgi:hypothetical protein
VGIEGWNPSAEVARVVKIFARRLDGSVVEASRLPGGLSDTTTLRLRVNDRRGRLKGIAFAKVGSVAVISEEASRFDRFVSPLLPVGSFAGLQLQVQAGSGATGGIFYQLAEAAPSLFELMQTHPELGAPIVQTLSERLQRWQDGGVVVEEISIDQLRVLARLPPIDVALMPAGRDWLELMARTIPVRRATQHGDMHGDNVLVYLGNQPVLIDYAEVGDMVSGYDAVVLELSLLFHPTGSRIRRAWPTPAQAERWTDFQSYVRDCPVPEFVAACRGWAMKSCPSDRSVVACAYAYAERQLRYPDTDKALVHGILVSAANALAA